MAISFIVVSLFCLIIISKLVGYYRKRKSAWFRGLLYAEEMFQAGVSFLEIEQEIENNCFECHYDAFDKGMYDFIEHKTTKGIKHGK